jgi:curved DNA-binding protein CbpA
MTLYDILGVSKEATDEELKRAYRALSKEHHPDVNEGQDERFKEIQFAYEIISDPDKRAEYDRTGRTGQDVFQEQVIMKAAEMMREMLFQTHYKTDLENFLSASIQSIARKRQQAEQLFKRDRDILDQIQRLCIKRATIDVLDGVLAQKRATVDSAEQMMLAEIKIFDAAVLLLREYAFEKVDGEAATENMSQVFQQFMINMSQSTSGTI